MDNAEFYKDILDSISDGVYFVDKSRKIVYWNRGAEKITGYSASEVTGTYCYDNILRHVDNDGKEICMAGCPLHAAIDDGFSRDAAIYLHHKRGYRVPVTVSTMAMREGGEISGAVEVFRDDSAKHDVLETLEEMNARALKDELTGLPGREYMQTTLRSAQQDLEALGITFGVVCLDIDGFRKINEEYGFDAGDELLWSIGKTLSANIRGADLIGRWFGGTLAGVFRCPDPESLRRIAEKLRILVESSSVSWRGYELKATVSAGAAFCRRGDKLDVTLKRAEELLRLSKAKGRNRVTLG